MKFWSGTLGRYLILKYGQIFFLSKMLVETIVKTWFWKLRKLGIIEIPKSWSQGVMWLYFELIVINRTKAHFLAPRKKVPLSTKKYKKFEQGGMDRKVRIIVTREYGLEQPFSIRVIKKINFINKNY